MLNNKQQIAIEYVKENLNIFLTGSPGTGKSYTLSEMIKILNQINRKYGVTALTGCAALLIKGQTLHSFLSLGLGNDKTEKIVENIKKYKPNYKKLYELQTLIIDEISMMDNILFDKISEILSAIKGNKKPFGGIQIILIGDFYQLPPISGDFCFNSDLWKKLNLCTVELTELVRQKDDIEFQEILQELRNCSISDKTYEKLLLLKKTVFPKNIVPTKLHALNTNVDSINRKEFVKLYKKNNAIAIQDKLPDINTLPNIIFYPKEDDREISDIYEADMKTIYTYNISSNNTKINKDEYIVNLIMGLKIIITRNIDFDNGLVNGTLGTIINLTPYYVTIKDIHDNVRNIKFYTDKNTNGSLLINNTTFMPIKPAYALSIHKSQGSTLDAVEIDGGTNIFTSGQLYTAISRAKTLKYVKLIDLDKGSFMTNSKVKEFYKTL
jgi:ATP-dependent DNA helicase PIF1